MVTAGSWFYSQNNDLLKTDKERGEAKRLGEEENGLNRISPVYTKDKDVLGDQVGPHSPNAPLEPPTFVNAST